MKQSLFINTLFAIILLFFISSSALAETPVASKLPANQQYQVSIITPLGDEEYSYLVEYSVAKDEAQVAVIVKGSGYHSNTVYDLDLNLIHGMMEVVNPDDVTRVGFDQRVAYAKPEKEQIILDFYLNEELQANRELYPPNNQATEIGILGLHLQGLLNQDSVSNLDFHGNLYDINRGSYFQLGTTLLSAKEIEKLTKGVRVPPQVKEILNNHDQIYVFKLAYTGLVRFLIPNNFHVVLEKQAPHRILAFWGGSSKLLRYELYNYLESE